MIRKTTGASTKPTIALVAGGTGGHFFPALALNEALQQAGYPTHVITDERTHFPETLSAKTPVKRTQLAPLNGLQGHALFAVKGLWQTLCLWRWMHKHRIQLVVGFGGYVSAPALLAGALAGARLMLHEQNSYAGRVTRLFTPLATCITTGFMTLKGLKSRWLSKCTYTGNPVRPVFRNVHWSPTESCVTLLILGGSQGARIMSHVVAPAIALLPPALRKKLNVYHQARPEDLTAVTSLYANAGITAHVQSFFDTVPALLSQADLAICRAGAATLSELMCVGTPALLIPYANAMDDHQTVNAQELAKRGAALVVKESTLNENELAKILEHVIKDNMKRREMAQQLRQMQKPNASHEMVKVIESLLNSPKE